MWWVIVAGASLLVGMFAVHDAVGGGPRGLIYGLGYAVALVLWLAWVVTVGSGATKLDRKGWRAMSVVYWVWSVAMFGAALAAFVALGATDWLVLWTVVTAATLGAVAAWLAEQRGPGA